VSNNIFEFSFKSIKCYKRPCNPDRKTPKHVELHSPPLTVNVQNTK